MLSSNQNIMKGCVMCIRDGRGSAGGEWMGTGAPGDNIVFTDRKTVRCYKTIKSDISGFLLYIFLSRLSD